MREAKNGEERRHLVERLLKINLKNIGNFSLDEKIVSSKNCENFIGAVQIPIGLAGPVKINYLKKSFEAYIPIATTEGALIASVSRGMKAINQCGGADIAIEKIGATRGPVFKIKNLNEGLKLEDFLNNNFIQIKKAAEKTSSHIKLKSIKGQIIGDYYFAKFVYNTGRAMGMNMATIATQKAADIIKKKLDVDCISISGNYCVDKKASWQNFTDGRGYKLWAEVTLTEKILKEVLKTNARKFFEVWLAKCMTGSFITGSLGANAQFANVISGIFIACGQDPAHITEGSLGITSAEILRKDLKISVYLPDIMIGTVGGGTGLATQKEALSIIDKNFFPQAIAAGVLAGEISLLASLSEGSLVNAHRRLGRGEEL